MDSSAYGQAVIHLAWYRNDKICHLLFGMVELRPSELPRAPGCCMQSFRVGSKDRRYVHYERFRGLGLLALSDGMRMWLVVASPSPMTRTSRRQARTDRPAWWTICPGTALARARLLE